VSTDACLVLVGVWILTLIVVEQIGYIRRCQEEKRREAADAYVPSDWVREQDARDLRAFLEHGDDEALDRFLRRDGNA
jgi:hypothetical protein